MNIWLVAFIVFLFNIPFGYWRANVKKFSLQWVLSIHLPVPFVVLLRILSHLGFQLYTFPIIIFAFFSGQFLGGKIFSIMKKHPEFIVTSCLFCDFFRIFIN
jgi:hypothetical protein